MIVEKERRIDLENVIAQENQKLKLCKRTKNNNEDK